MAWKQLSITTSGDRAELLGRTFDAAGAVSVTFADAADNPVLEPAPGETRVWPTTRLSALFADDTDLAPLHAALAPFLTRSEQASWEVGTLADRVWERVWLEHFRPLRFGHRLWICPSSDSPPDPAATNIFLDPGLAFGTGAHPTTALCLEWLDAAELEGTEVIDYGCGSGILAIAAAKLGARDVRAIDIDSQAIAATVDNAARNGVADRVRANLPELMDSRPADILLANILSGPLVELFPRLAKLVRRGGWIVLSGILAEQTAAVRTTYASGFQLQPPARREGWVLLSGRRR